MRTRLDLTILVTAREMGHHHRLTLALFRVHTFHPDERIRASIESMPHVFRLAHDESWRVIDWALLNLEIERAEDDKDLPAW